MGNGGRFVPIAGLAAVCLLVAGVAVFATGRGRASFGWFTYAPLSSDQLQPLFNGLLIWSRREAVGAALGVLGVVIGATAVGYRLGRRAAQRP